MEVRGGRERAPSRDRVAASTVVSGEELRGAGQSSSAVLSRVPGVQVLRTGSSSDLSTAAIRGATSAETPVYLAGIRLNDDITGTADLSTIPLAFIDRIEVYRGNAPLAGDRLGIGGAVFFEPRFPRRSELGLGAGAGSFGALSGQASGSVASERASSLVAIRHEGADNDFSYARRDGGAARRINADYDATDAWAIGRYQPGGGVRLLTLLHAYDREQGTPGVAPVPNDRARTDLSRLLGAVSARIPCGQGDAGAERCTLEILQSGLGTRAVLDDQLLRAAPTRIVETRGWRSETQARVKVEAATWATLGGSLTAGLQGIAVEQPGTPTLSATRLAVRPAAMATFHLSPRTDLLGMGAVECETTRGQAETSAACATFEPAARVGAMHELDRHVRFRANLGRYARVPTLGELHGVSAVVRGNPALAPETGETADVGVDAHFESKDVRVRVDFFGFARRASDLVAYRQNALGVIVPYNVGRARVLGAELSLVVDAFDALRNELAATVMEPTDTTPGRTVRNDILPYRSRLVLSDYAEVGARRGIRGSPLSSAALGVRVTHKASRYADSAGLIVIPHQTVFDIEARAATLRDTLTLRLAMRNVFAAVEVDTIGLPLPGRSVHATLEAVVR